jgi:hypothetical protein
MSIRVVHLELDENTCRDLEAVAAHLGLGSIDDALRAAAAEWLARRKSEIEDRDPAQRYFINEALDELMARKR